MNTVYPNEPITDYNDWIKYIYDQVSSSSKNK